MQNKTFQAAVYLRLSREDGDVTEGSKQVSNSIANQNELVMDYLKSRPEISVISTYTDDGYMDVDFDRPEFQRMLSDIREGKVNCIVVKDCSRFGRDYVELGDYLEQLFPFLGVRFIAINDHYDSKTCEGGLDIAFKNLVYDIYSRDLSKKVRESRRQMALQGKYTAGQTMYGYRKKKGNVHKLEIDPEAAGVVREIFDMRLAGMGLTDIDRNLTERDIKCATVYKHDKGEATNHGDGFDMMCWTSSAVYQVLINENYTGAVVSLKSGVDRVSGKLKTKPKDEWVKVDGMHEAIVSKEEFWKVQKSFSEQALAAPFKKTTLQMRYLRQRS